MMDYEARALSRLLWQYRSAQKMRAFVSLVPAQADGHFESAAQKLLNVLDVSEQSGALLEVIGALVGQPREGLAVGDDDFYRALIRSRIAKNSSDCRIDSIARSISRVANAAVFRLVDNQDMTFELEFSEPLTAQFKSLLKQFDILPKPQGVRAIGIRAPTQTPVFAYKLAGKPARTGVAGFGLIRNGQPPEEGGYYALVYEVL